MASFLEKLKKGMGAEIPESAGEPAEEFSGEIGENPEEKTREKLEEKKSPPKRKKINSVRKSKTFTQPLQEAGFSDGVNPVRGQQGVIEAQTPLEVNRAKKEHKEDKPLTGQTSNGVKKIMIESQAAEPLAPKKEEEKVSEPDHQGFSLQNLGGQEGQLAVDVYQTDGELIIQSAIAGVRPEDLDISIESDVVLIKGNREKPPEDKEINYFYQECYWGPFSRKIILPEEADPGRAEATIKQGILTIRMPKIEREKKRKISIKS